jgi:hypothetical protein
MKLSEQTIKYKEIFKNNNAIVYVYLLIITTPDWPSRCPTMLPTAFSTVQSQAPDSTVSDLTFDRLQPC